MYRAQNYIGHGQRAPPKVFFVVVFFLFFFFFFSVAVIVVNYYNGIVNEYDNKPQEPY